MHEPKSIPCPDCDGLSRRDLFRAALTATALVPAVAAVRPVLAARDPRENTIARLFGSLNSDQKAKVCFGWEHQKRLMISNNWQIVPQTIGEFYTPEQQAMIKEIFEAAHNSEWIPKRLQQLQDDGGGLPKYAIALFGEPGTGKFEWVLTGRHLTLRVDGDSEPGVAFGGPIFYGHAAQGFNEKPDHPGNVYWYQALRANEVFQALDGKQRSRALIEGPVPQESPSVLLSHAPEFRAGLPVEEMSRDQRELVEKVLADLMAPFNSRDVEEARRYLKANGGSRGLHMAFYKQEDLGSDGLWDVWKLEGPAMAWYFRGAPHVHVWAYLSEKPLTVPHPGPRSGA